MYGTTGIDRTAGREPGGCVVTIFRWGVIFSNSMAARIVATKSAAFRGESEPIRFCMPAMSRVALAVIEIL
jgi:hypothetical protein